MMALGRTALGACWLLVPALAVGVPRRAPPAAQATRTTLPRRAALAHGAGALGAALGAGADARAAAPLAPGALAAAEALGGPPERVALLRAIREGRDADAEAAVRALVPLDPSRGRAATSAALGGRWELVWSANAAAFSPLLTLPPPVRPRSAQLLGGAAAARVGDGRVAQLLEFPLGLSAVLSAGSVPDTEVAARADGRGARGGGGGGGGDARDLIIFPPFRLELALPGGASVRLVEAGSDAEFRALNARDASAQAAPRNTYRQLYLEAGDSAAGAAGQPGELRVSEVVGGDPVIVGSLFVHARVASA